ncbi:putative oxidoreductase [Vibrio ishigakensis]|uniref:Putative oxidoreductase n=1 Tax=Vibrio ishigakensis TaxID=1481914 RepID=A0A0B8NWJ4_9VIBR|nr:putative oxidoreductase [Vibrio ishigakensis]
MDKIAKALQLAYKPTLTQGFEPRIALIGCGEISGAHLQAYQKAGYQVVALCDIDQQAMEKRQQEFFPEAKLYSDYEVLLEEASVDIVDITTHPDIRVKMIEKAIVAGKHILSQKPYVLNLEDGLRLAELAEAKGVKLAINQNARWAPHFSYLKEAVRQGLVGEVQDVQLCVNWDHNMIASMPFNEMKYAILYDFGIHWFDMLAGFMHPKKAVDVMATAAVGVGQTAKPPLLNNTIVRYENAQASIVLSANTMYGQNDRTVIIGTQGTLVSEGPNLNQQTITLHTKEGRISPVLEEHGLPMGSMVRWPS